jgi:FlaA1/EpsC-like NDP-sugar epimerase
MGTPIKIADMARDLIRLMGKEPGEDVDIRYIGLRAGEKMREELYSPEESIRRTAHDKILVVRPGENGPNPWSAHSAAFDTALRDLFHAAREQDEAEVRRKLRGLVPEYGRSAEEEAEVCRAAE